MPKCPDLLDLQSYVDGELTPSEMDVIARHIQVCADCAAIVRRIRIGSMPLAAMTPPTPPAELLPRIATAVEHAQSGITCQTARELVHAEIDAALADGEEEALTAHLADCADCRHYASRTRLIAHVLRAIPHIRPPAGLKASIEAAVDRAASPFHRFRARFSNVASLAAAAAILIVAFLTMPALQITGRGPTPQPPSETIALAPTDIEPTNDHANTPADPDYVTVADQPSPQPSDTAEADTASVGDPTHPVSAPVFKHHLKKPGRSRPETTVVTAISPHPDELPPSETVGPPPPVEPNGTETSLPVGPLVDIEPVSVAPERVAATQPLPKKTATTDAAVVSKPIAGTPTQPPLRPSPIAPTATLAKATPRTPVSLRAENISAHPPIGRRLPTVDADAARSVHRSDPSPDRFALAAERIDKKLKAHAAASELPASW